MCEAGELSQKCHELEVEWKIKDTSLSELQDAFIYSPSFSLSDAEWSLWTFPNGDPKALHDSVGWIGLYLEREDDGNEAKTVHFVFGFKREDGTTEGKYDATWRFDSYGGYGRPKIIQKSELLRRKSELMPSNTLTIICTLRVLDSSNCTAGLETLSQNLTDLLTSEKGCDFKMKVKNTIFPVHKSILVARSSVFASMFTHDTSEKNSGVINIADCEPEAFKEFLLYLYSGRFESSSSNVFHLYKIADKYDIQELRSCCVGYIMSNLSIETICEAVSLGHIFKESQLNLKTQEFFNENFGKIVSTLTWKKFLKRNCDLANQLLEKNVIQH